MDKLAVYVHWPYCARICPYCDFNVYKGARNDALVTAIVKDLEHWQDLSGPREIISIHFGGGTPSLMSAANIEAIISSVDSLWSLPGDIEIGLEANPHDADKSLWESYRAAGINRLSLGVQSFHDPALKMLGRDHDALKAESALELAGIIFANYSLDLIFGWAEQSAELLNADLDKALSYKPSHLSAYQLTIEPGTAFDKAEQRGQNRAVDNDASAEFCNLVGARLNDEGFDHYEVSNFARKGQRSRHNLAYWQGHDYVGVGPGAHGRLTINGKRGAMVAANKPDNYVALVNETGSGIFEKESLSPEDWGAEYLMMGLRIMDGISKSRYQSISGQALSAEKLTELRDNSLIQIEGDRLTVTDKGRLVLNKITEELLI